MMQSFQDEIYYLKQDLEHKKIAIRSRNARIKELEAQIEKMKCDVLSLIKDGMNDDIDQNIIERLADKWEIKND